MDKVLLDLSSAYWWISVFLAGIIIDVLAAYLKPVLDRVSSFVSAKARAASNQSALEFEARVRRVVESPLRLTELRLEAIYLSVRATLVVVIGILGLVVFAAADDIRLRAFLSTAMAVVTFVPLVLYLRWIRRIRRVIREAGKALGEDA